MNYYVRMYEEKIMLSFIGYNPELARQYDFLRRIKFVDDQTLNINFFKLVIEKDEEILKKYKEFVLTIKE